MGNPPQNTALFHSVISAGLSDPDIKKAVLDYLKAETDRIKPPEEWREVWFQVSEDTRLYKQSEYDCSAAEVIKNRALVKLRLHVEYDPSRSTAVIVGTLVSAKYPYLIEGLDTWMHKWQYRKSIDAPDYTIAIRGGQAAWDEAYKWFMELTEV
jgi:hypothetical protein